MNYVVMHRNKAISEQSSKFLCNSDDLCSYASQQSTFRTKFYILCITDDLCGYASKQSNFRTEF